MAFDFTKAASVEMKRKSADTKKQTLEQATNNSIGKLFDAQKANYENNNLMTPKGKPKPSNWMRQDEAGNWFISWRIANKPVYFTPDFVETKGWMYSENVISDLESIRDEIASGKHKEAIKAAYDRKPEPKKKAEASE